MCGAEDMNAVLSDLRQIALCGWVVPHLHIHRGGNRQRARATLTRQNQITEQVIRHAMRDFRHHVCSTRRNQHGIGFAREVDVGDVAVHTRAIEP